MKMHKQAGVAGRRARRFDVHGIAVNRVWVSDSTYRPTRAGWLYRATVLDLGSRRCVGWAMRDTMEVALAVSARRMAQEARQPLAGLIHHSELGYISPAEYEVQLQQAA